MKAVRVEQFGGPEVLRVESVADLAPSAGQVLVRVHAAGVNPVETYIRAGQYARLPPLPYTPGTDAAGIVEAVGAGVTTLHPGDRVYTAGSVTGTYAERTVAAVADVYPLPDNVDFEQGSALGVPYATAYRALFQRACAQAGEVVLIHGATGAVGLAAIQLARAAGLRVLATGGTSVGREKAAAQGADCVLDHHAESHWQTVLDETGGLGVDVVLEMLANVNLARDLQIVASSGRVAVIGSRGPVEINPRDAMAREASILGVLLWSMTPAEARQAHAALYGGMSVGALKPVVGAAFTLEDAARAHEQLMQPGAGGKLVLVP